MHPINITLYNSFKRYSSLNASVVLYEINIRYVYKKIFDEALQKYNAKQKRKDRIILDYYKHICSSKQQEPYCELVIQFGEKCTNSKTVVELGKKILVEYYNIFIQQYNKSTNIYVVGMYLGYNDNVPRLYIKYVPVAHNFKTGLETRVSKNKALIEMGYSHYSNEQQKVIGDYVMFRKKIADELEQISIKYNITLNKPYSNMLTNNVVNSMYNL